LAFSISGLTTILWFACVLPAGPLVGAAATVSGDAATPMFRAAWLLVPSLLVLIVGPAGIVLSQSRSGRLAVLAATDAFIAGYAGVVLLLRLDLPRMVSLSRAGLFEIGMLVRLGLVSLLFVLALFSALELVRVLRDRPAERIHPFLKGLRLALCLFVLVIPSWMLFSDGLPSGALLIPYVFVVVSTAGAAFAEAALGLRLTASLVHTLLAAFVLLVLKHTMFFGEPRFERIGRIGWGTLGLAGLVFLLAVLQVLRIARNYRVLRRDEA